MKRLIAVAALTLAACGSVTTTSDASVASVADAGSLGDASVLVGSFQVRLVPNDDGGVSVLTTVSGKVADGPTPSLIAWSNSKTVGDCSLLVPRVPFCATSCGGSAACVEDGVCQAYPSSRSQGVVKVTGVRTAAGDSTFTMSPVVNVYQATKTLAAPPFARGELVTVSAEGATWRGFELSAPAIDSLVLSSAPLVLAVDQPLALRWVAGASSSTVTVRLDISHHGGTKGKIECTTADDGALDLDATLVGSLLGLGVAGFPSVIVTRHSVGATVIEPGRVELDLASDVERPVAIPGLVSCASNTDCPDAGTCQADLTCQ